MLCKNVNYLKKETAELKLLISQILVWGPVDDTQDPSWTGVTDTQDPTWSSVSDSQNPGWEEVA